MSGQRWAASVARPRSLTHKPMLGSQPRPSLQELSSRLRKKSRVIYQSVLPPARRRMPRDDVFEVCVIGDGIDESDDVR